MPKKTYSVELTRMLEDLKTKRPSSKNLKDLNAEEREIYMNAVQKVSKEAREKLFRLVNKGYN